MHLPKLGARPSRQLDITVLNGNLTFIGQPLMVGRYKSVDLTGTEDTIDLHIGGGMRVALALGTYPEAPGTFAIFRNAHQEPNNPWRLPRPRAAIVIGLGEEGSLRAADLEFSVSQGAKGWAQRAAEGRPAPPGLEIAATLIGSGGIGISAGIAARAIATGVRRANQRLLNLGLPLITRLTLVKSGAWTEPPTHGTVCACLRWRHRAISRSRRRSPRALRPFGDKPAGGYRATDYDLISVTAPSTGSISFALDTRRARSEVRRRAGPARVDPAVGRKGRDRWL